MTAARNPRGAALPSVSVILPVFDGERYLGEAIQSVLAQSYPALELIVVDDGSTDGSAEVALGFGDRVRLVSQENRGPGPARNLGVEHARGQLLAFLDADDLWDSEKLNKQVAAYTRSDDVEIIYCHARQFFSPELDPEQRRTIRIQEEPVPARLTVAMLVSVSDLQHVGRFRDLKVGTNLDWHMRAVEAGLRMEVLPDVLYHRRIHESNHGIRHKQDAKVQLHILKQALERRRSQDR